MMTVSVWPKGYADWTGPSTFEVADGTERSVIDKMAADKYGYWARVYSVREKYVPSAPVIHDEKMKAYIRMMSRDS